MGLERYRNFFILVSRLGAGAVQVSVSGLPPGPRVPDAVSVQYRQDHFLINDNGNEVDLLAKVRRRPVKSEYLYRLGILLSEIVLPPGIREGFLKSYETARNNRNRLRLRLILEEPRLATLPWEYLYLESAPGARNPNDFLVLNPDISFARLAAANTSEQAFPASGKYRLTAAFSSPTTEDPLNIEADRAAIRTAVEQAANIGEIVPKWAFRATVDLLQDKLREGCDIFHFSGHGVYAPPSGEIILEKSDGTGESLSAEVLSQLLVSAKVKVAVLSACETAMFAADNPFGGVATSLAGSGIPAVVASQFRLLDKNALPLVREVYRSLLQGHEIDDGVFQARRAILARSGLENRDWGAIVLYLRGEDGIVFRQDQPTQPRRVVPRIFPTPLQTPLLGRTQAIAEVEQKVGAGMKFYLHGGVGVGKTSLTTAIFSAVADDTHFPDGFIWASAQGMNGERLIEYLGSNFPDQTVSKAQGKAEKINELRKVLASYPNLLIGLDDITTFDAARSVLDAAGKCSIVLNGETAFDLTGRATAIEVQPLTAEVAKELFMAEAKLSTGNLTIEESVLIVRICDRLRGLPLGIKIAAGKYAEGESLQTVWDRIDAAGVLATSAIEALVDTVLDDLKAAPEAQRLLVRLASFPALEAPIRSLQDEDSDNLTGFFQAKDKLLALHVIEKAGSDRLALHPLLGPLIVQKSNKATAKVERDRMFEWLFAYAHANREDPSSLALEHRNMVALMDALKRGKRWKAIARVMEDLFEYFRVRGLWVEALSRLDLCLSHGSELNELERASCLLQRGIIRTLLSRYIEADSDLAIALQIYTDVRDNVGMGRAQYRRAVITTRRGTFDGVADKVRVAILNMTDTAPQKDRAGAHLLLGQVLSSTDPAEEALVEFRKALSISEQAGDLEQQARAHRCLGLVHDRRAEIKLAQDEYRFALEAAAKIGDVLERASIQQSIGQMQYHGSHYDEARDSFEAALRQFTELGYQYGIASARHGLGNVYLAKAAYVQAEEKYRESLTINEALGHVQQAAYNRYQLSIVSQRHGDLAAAEKGYQEALGVARQIKDQTLEGGALVQLARLALLRRENSTAADWAKQALAVGVQIDDRMTAGLAELFLGRIEDAYRTLLPFDSEETRALFMQIASSKPKDVGPDDPALPQIDVFNQDPQKFLDSDSVDRILDSQSVDRILDFNTSFSRILHIGPSDDGEPM